MSISKIFSTTNFKGFLEAANRWYIKNFYADIRQLSDNQIKKLNPSENYMTLMAILEKVISDIESQVTFLCENEGYAGWEMKQALEIISVSGPTNSKYYFRGINLNFIICEYLEAGASNFNAEELVVYGSLMRSLVEIFKSDVADFKKSLRKAEIKNIRAKIFR